MSFKESIVAKGNPEMIYDLFSGEDKVFRNNRSRYELKKEKNAVVFTINAKDEKSLEITKNSIKRLLFIFKKIRWLVQNE